MAADVATFVNSSWVECMGLKNNTFFVEFKAYPGKGKVCCSYPNCGPAFYDMALVYASKGHFIRQWLYKLWPYNIIQCPCAQIIAGGLVFFGLGGVVIGGSTSYSFVTGLSGTISVEESSGRMTVNSTVGLTTGDSVTISGMVTQTSLNATWTITVNDATHFTIPFGPAGGSEPGVWVKN